MRTSRPMLIWRGSRLFCALLACSLPLFGFGQPRFLTLSTDSGLSQNSVFAIVQDHVGYLWLGTQEGLNRYDGYSFKIFRHDPRDPKSLPDNNVSAIYEDHQNRLWVGTIQGLSLFDPETETFRAEPVIRDQVTCIQESDDGSLWVGSQGGALYRRDPKTGKFNSFTPVPQHPESIGSFRVSQLLIDQKKRLWIGTYDAGLDLFVPNGEFGSFVHFRHDPSDPNSLSSNEVWGLGQDANGKIWIATYGGGVDVLDPDTHVFEHHRYSASDPHGLPNDLTTALMVDRAGTVWVGTDGAGLLRYDAAQDKFVAFTHDEHDSNSISQNVVRSVYQDHQGHLWVGTFMSGVDLMREPRREFALHTHDPKDPASLSDAQPASFVEYDASHILIGTEAGYLNDFDENTSKIKSLHFPSPLAGGPSLLSLHKDHRGRIWVGTYLQGLALFDPKSAHFTIYKHREGDDKSLSNDEVWSIAEDADGNLWLATNRGVDRFDPEKREVVSHYTMRSSGGVSYAGVRALLFDHNGDLWAGTLGGLDRIPPGGGEVTVMQHSDEDPDSLPSDAVVALHEDSAGRLWIGTLSGGLASLDPLRKHLTEYKHFPSNAIYSIQEESSGKLWLSTNHGLCRFNPKNGQIETFDLTNGLESLQFHLGAGLTTHDGKVLFGSTNGFYQIDPSLVVADQEVPRVVLTGLRLFNEAVPLSRLARGENEIDLTRDDKVLSLDFAALDFNFPKRNEYSYQLQGFSDRWLPLGTRHEITLTNLDPGFYQLRVKASNSDGFWGDRPALTLAIRVLPPFWETWWFRAIFLGLLVTFTYLFHRRRVWLLTRRIAEQHKTESTLRALEQRFAKAFHANPTPMVITRQKDGSVVDINESYLRLLGYARDELIERNVFDVGILDFSQNHEAGRDFIEKGSVRDAEVRTRARAGQYRTLLLSAEIIEIGVELCILAAGLDITEHKRLEEELRQSQKIEAIGKLAGGIAHDFNNLLTVIKGYCDLLADHPHDAEPRSHLQRITEAADRAAGLTRQLLAFSRRQVLQPKVINLNTLVLNVEKLLGRLIGEDVEIEILIAPDLGLVKADPGQFEQVIMNLAVNARDALPSGGKVKIRTFNLSVGEAQARPADGLIKGDYVVLALSDNGHGMDGETMSHIFEPFFTTKEVGKGTGLGLSTVYGIVRQSGGYISVESEEGRGTTFCVYMPRVFEQIDATVSNRSTSISRGNETVLLVEDDEAVRELARDVLSASGYNVLVADCPKNAIAKALDHEGRIDLLLTDVVMPGISGSELAKDLCTTLPEMKVLFMSGHTNNPAFLQTVAESDSSLLNKPFTPASLTKKVRDVLSRTRATAK